MRPLSKPLAWLALSLSPAAAAPLSAVAGGAADAVVLRPGAVVDPGRGVVYLMRPRGGIDALELSSGRSLWSTQDAAKPLLAAGELLIALAERSRPGAADPASPPRLDVVLLDARDGRPRRTIRVALPDRLWSAVDDGPGRSLKVAATLQRGGGVVVSWLVEETPMKGIAPEAGVAGRAAGG